jgi:hypothetical protein
MPRRFIFRVRTAAFFVLLAGGACTGTGGEEARSPARSAVVDVIGVRPGVTSDEFMAMPDSVRLGGIGAGGTYETGRGVAVEVDVRLEGFAGDSVPLAYTLHDARNKVPFISQTVPVTPGAEVWRRRGQVWLPVPSPGTYYVQVALNDSTGRRTDGPRSSDFTVR